MDLVRRPPQTAAPTTAAAAAAATTLTYHVLTILTYDLLPRLQPQGRQSERSPHGRTNGLRRPIVYTRTRQHLNPWNVQFSDRNSPAWSRSGREGHYRLYIPASNREFPQEQEHMLHFRATKHRFGTSRRPTLTNQRPALLRCIAHHGVCSQARRRPNEGPEVAFRRVGGDRTWAQAGGGWGGTAVIGHRLSVRAVEPLMLFHFFHDPATN